MVEVGEEPELESLLEFLKTSHAFDFTGYKRSSLKRRIEKRMQAVHIRDVAAYQRHLELHPNEFAELFNTILINVSSFFRDPETWDYLAATVIPRVIGSKAQRSPIRVWTAACATGQEPYTVAMLLAEALGIEEYCRRVKIYATDLDEEALEYARHARFDARVLADVPPQLRAKYFQGENHTQVFHSGLRRSVIFGRHDLIEDAPISHVDLLICRNVLMYFNLATQSRILSRLHFALSDSGYLLLGRAEMLLSHPQLFSPLELKHRIFSKVPGPLIGRDMPRTTPLIEAANHELPRQSRLRESALDAAPVAQIVIDEQNRLVLFNERASATFGLARPDFGKLFQDLELSYRPIDLRTLIDKARETGHAAKRDSVEYNASGGGVRFFDVLVTPLVREGVALGFSITFDDVTRHQELQQSLLRFGENLETAYEELQSANEELETTNEELQSSNEELETTNEELQAANEEMETVNEELRSTNEELTSTNDQLRRREMELNVVNGFLNAILGSLRAGVAVTNSALEIQLWNERATDMWGLRQSEVEGRSLLELDIGLPVAELEQPIRVCMDGNEPQQQILLDAVNRRGKSFRCQVTINALNGKTKDLRGAIVIMDDGKSCP